MSKRSCETCEWLKRYKDPRFFRGTNFIGECRRNPPQEHITYDEPGEVYSNPAWPDVVGGDWCGEYKQQEDGK